MIASGLGLDMLFFIIWKQDTSGLVDSAVSYGVMRPGFKTRWRRIVSEMREFGRLAVCGWWHWELAKYERELTHKWFCHFFLLKIQITIPEKCRFVNQNQITNSFVLLCLHNGLKRHIGKAPHYYLPPLPPLLINWLGSWIWFSKVRWI